MVSRLSPASSLHLCRPCAQRIALRSPSLVRFLTTDHRNRRSTFFAPSGGITPKDLQEDVYSLLVRTGFLRQAHSGIFHYLPLGQRVHEKLERLIDRHMRSIGASKLALSTISSEKLWAKTGRLSKGGAELFRFKDRKGTKLLLSPTHEEEITTLIGSLINSYKELPLRVYQIGRKFRDERRPRAGLLRGKEFTMKDLYTFDSTEAAALETYHEVQGAYRAFFDEIKLPYIVAEADSGDIGGTLSHEYHYPSPSGEDNILSCSSCTYTSNEEAARARAPSTSLTIEDPADIAVFHGITHDRKTLLNVFYPKNHTYDEEKSSNGVNMHKIKSLIPEFDPGVGASALNLYVENFSEYSIDSENGTYSQIINLFDLRLPRSVTEASFSNHSDQPIFREFIADKRIPTTSMVSDPATDLPLNLLKIRAGDRCPKCEEGSLTVTSAVELGHTFHLGTRYSEPLKSVVANEKGEWNPIVMGCHGIGISRMISAVADGYKDEIGLCWPRVVAPFEAIVVYKDVTMRVDAEEVYDLLSSRGLERGEGVDTLLDDRERDLVWKMKDADLVGYPIMVVLGRSWAKEKMVEVQVRKTKQKVEVGLSDLKEAVEGFLKDL